MPDEGYVTISTDDPPMSVTCLMGDGPPTPTGGYGGWEEVDRPKRTSITEWRGGKPHKMSLPVMLDGHASNTVIESQVAALERMGRAEGGNDEPPLVNIEFPASRPRTPSVDWVLQDISWGDAIYVGGLRTRQAATLEFMQYVDDESIITLSPAKRRKRKSKSKKGKAKKGARQKTYQVKRGDTLSSIAARFLGSGDRWKEIAKLNNIRDPRNLKVGRTLKLP